jgi:prepilin-type N-terminal cleavage/methylation domain-containing protein
VFSDREPSHRHHGFTLVEVMVALLIFMVIALGLAKGEISALWAQRNNIFRDEALRLTEDELSRLKGEQFTLSSTAAALTATAPAWTAQPDITVNMRNGTQTFARSFQITDIATSAIAMKRIDVAVGWTQGNNPTLLAPTNRNHQTSLSTIIIQSE